MYNLIEWLSSQLNITTLIAVAGFVISLITAIHSMITRRKCLSARILTYDLLTSKVAVTIFFENHSELPIAITNVKLITDDRKINCSPFHELMFMRNVNIGTPVFEREGVYSDELPLQLSSLGAAKRSLLFDGVPKLSKKGSKSLSFEIYTNRGRAVQMKLELDKDVRSLRS